MRTFRQLMLRLDHYKNGTQYIYHKDGYIVWQTSTGENVQILFIEVKTPRNGVGTSLLRDMCESINPYHSVFVVRRATNEAAGKFYRKVGFTETLIKGLYKGEDAVLATISFEQLKKNVQARERSKFLEE